MNGGASMDTISLDGWELLPDHKSSFFMEECTNGHGTFCDEEDKKPLLPPLPDAYEQDPVMEFKDIGVVETESRQGELSKVTEILISDAEEMIKCPAGAKEVHEDEVMVEAAPAPHLCVEEEEGVKKERKGLEGTGFGVGKLRVNGAGALCSFGVAAATFCIFLLGGRQQQQHKKENQKIQFQMYADDERIQQAVQKTSRLNQAMSSVMGGASSRASISFGGYYYDGF